MLRDWFVCGLRHQRTTQRLLTEADLTFHKAVSISTTMEAASKDSRELCQAQGTASASVNKVSVSECWVFYAVPKLGSFSQRKPVRTYSVLVENKFGLFQSWVIESMR